MIKQNGKRLENQVIDAVDETYSLAECLALCTRRYDCKSLNYAERLSMCEINSEFESSESLSDDQQYVYVTTVDTDSCEPSAGNFSECCYDVTGSYNLQDRSCPGSSFQWCTCMDGFTGPKCTLSSSFSGIAVSCQQYQDAGHDLSGVLQIDLTSIAPVDVICDMDTDDGGWTVIQRRSDGSCPFNNTWDEYVNGFGSVDDEYWLGLENIYQLSEGSANGVLRVEITDYSGNEYYATYSFGIVENSRYRARFTHIEGNAGDSLSYNDNQPFSTRDLNDDLLCIDDETFNDEIVDEKMFSSSDNSSSDNNEEEVVDGISCSEYSAGTGWWFKSGVVRCIDCSLTNLNAPHAAALKWGSIQNIKQIELKYRN
ncbi:ficolin-1-like [Antedon mediterranea]|uniref:ficolin-1-like n=1 Tax=Antedon mediterranea TaxID=105859 RepID=UPI003AF84937